jgi:ABC-type glycerol-3-phosphate transport system substrate-binding protein
MSRKFIFASLAAILIVSILLLGACAPAPAPAPQIVKETVVVEKQVEKVVEKPVEKVVEKNVVVTATPAPEATAAPKPKGKIVLWGWTAALRDTLEKTGLIEDFKKAYPDIDVEIVYYPPADVYTNLPLAIAAGQGAPDVSVVENSHIAEYVHQGGLLDLTDLIKPYKDNIVEYKLNDCQKDGKDYCVPWDGGPVVLYYRRDVFEKAGLPTDPKEVSAAIATWDDYLKACQTIKEKTGLSCFANNKANNYGRLYEMMLWQQGLGYYDAKTGDVTVDSPENIATLEMLGKFWKDNLVSDTLEWTDDWYAEMASLDKPVASLVEASWMDVFLKSWIAPGTAGKWGVAEMPAFKAGETRAANDGGSAFVIPAQTKNAEAAKAFVEFAMLNNEKYQLGSLALSGFMPSLKSAYDDPMFLEGDSYFAGQQVRQTYADVNGKIPSATVYGPNYRMMNSSVATAIQKFATGSISAADALKGAADEIKANLQ